MRLEYMYFVRGDKYARQAVTSIASIRRLDPLAQVGVFTDYGVELKYVDAAIYWLPLGTKELSPQRAKAEAVVTAALNSSVDMLVVLDTDTIVLKQPNWAAADVVVTWRDHERIDEYGAKFVGVADAMPYNAGVYGIRPNSRGVECAIWLRENMARQSPERQAWYCDQLALVDLCGRPPVVGESLELATLYWSPERPGPVFTLAKVPCNVWNYTPTNGYDSSHAAILHFKGRSRGLFGAAASAMGLPPPELLV